MAASAPDISPKLGVSADTAALLCETIFTPGDEPNNDRLRNQNGFANNARCVLERNPAYTAPDGFCFYNNQRPHPALGIKTPAEAFALAA